jgi:acetolactate synthase-1/2/3 large subunit
MNGAKSLIRTLAGNGVEVCFANPGTSELHFVAALVLHPRMHKLYSRKVREIDGMLQGNGEEALIDYEYNNCVVWQS